MQIAILSDIHGNLTALNCVLEDISEHFKPNYYALLGDNIDYGMRSNEVIRTLIKLDRPLLCNLWGNHENAIMKEDYSRFSSMRGVASAKYTRDHLTQESFLYITEMENREGMNEFTICDKKFLAVHGNIRDPFWGKINPKADLTGYEEYDFVFSGHTHCAHCFPEYYSVDNREYRGKKKTVFINPGSVGQPRNHIPKAQYAIWDEDDGIFLRQVAYDVAYEQSLFTDKVDRFYSERLTRGI